MRSINIAKTESKAVLQKSVFVFASLVIASSSAFLQAKEKEQLSEIPGAFRVQVEIVPVDVIALDGEGQPVLGLTRDDFVVLEDGTVQEITYFLAGQQLRAEDLPPQPEVVPSPGQEFTVPPASQTFLILLGRGRQLWFRPIGDLIQFIQEELPPTDRIAIMAYNRITSFTTDHAAVCSVLRRYGRFGQSVETLLD